MQGQAAEVWALLALYNPFSVRRAPRLSALPFPRAFPAISDAWADSAKMQGKVATQQRPGVLVGSPAVQPHSTRFARPALCQCRARLQRCGHCLRYTTPFLSDVQRPAADAAPFALCMRLHVLRSFVLNHGHDTLL